MDAKRREWDLIWSESHAMPRRVPFRDPRFMTLHSLTREQILPLSLDEAWEFFSSPRNLGSLTPPDLGFRIVHCPSEKMHEGQIIEYRVKILPGLWVPWVSEIKA